jgi:nitroreductase
MVLDAIKKRQSVRSYQDKEIPEDVLQKVLEAASLGLGTCWIGAFYQDQVKEILGVPENVRISSLMPLGYPKELDTKTERKPLSEIICYDKYKA